jgi:hypothetical protein
MDKKQASHIETQLKALHASFQQLSGGDSVESIISVIHKPGVESIISVIHKPGWTTIAEVALFTGIVDSMVAHTNALASLKQALFSGAAKVELNPQPLPPGRE